MTHKQRLRKEQEIVKAQLQGKIDSVSCARILRIDRIPAGATVGFNTQFEIRRATEILETAAKKALLKVECQHKGQEFGQFLARARQEVELAFTMAIRRQCANIIDAAKMSPSIYGDLQKRRLDARKRLGDELRAARATLRALRWKVKHADEEAYKVVSERAVGVRRDLATRLVSARTRLKALRSSIERESGLWSSSTAPIIKEAALLDMYPDVPHPTFMPHREGIGLPETAGVYFLWSGDAVEYVGKATRLSNRLRLGSHHILREDHLISFVFADACNLDWTECFYIGALRPKLNFGMSAAHYTKPAHSVPTLGA